MFLLAWDEVFFAWVLTSSPDVQTVPVGLRLYMGQHATRYDLMMAAAVVSVVPVLLLRRSAGYQGLGPPPSSASSPCC